MQVVARLLCGPRRHHLHLHASLQCDDGAGGVAPRWLGRTCNGPRVVSMVLFCGRFCGEYYSLSAPVPCARVPQLLHSAATLTCVGGPTTGRFHCSVDS
jgi:hypothetical protein